MIQEFYKPQTIAEAVALKEKYKDEAVFMAGGTDVNCRNATAGVEKVIGLEQLNLNKISKTDEALFIGAGVTIQELIDSPNIPDQISMAAGHFVNRNIRNMATVGGNIASNNSTSNLIPVLVALDAELTLAGSESSVSVYDYTTLEMSRLIEGVTISSESLKKPYGLQKFSRTANDISIIVAAVTFHIEDEILSDVRVAVGGVNKHVVRLKELESNLEGLKLPARTEIEDTVKKAVTPFEDIRGGVRFKKYLAGVLVSDCIYDAYHGRAGNSKY
jgi:putative selenate reductase FAD-binding subunit